MQRSNPEEQTRLVHRLKGAEQRLQLSEERANQLQLRYHQLLNAKTDTVESTSELISTLKSQLENEISQRQAEQQVFKNIFKDQEAQLSNMFIQKKLAEQKKTPAPTSTVHPSTFFK
jgi:TRAP-type mannitol/chloroaromatic compound transport system substrate-binding protein